ncbi:MAG: MerR family DNA-binding protein [Paracoccaceae bacterium]
MRWRSIMGALEMALARRLAKVITRHLHRTPTDDVRAIQFVRDAQSLGLTLGEISTLLQSSWGDGEMVKVAAAHRRTVRERIAALNRIDKVLSSLEMCRCDSFAECSMNATHCKQVDCPSPGILGPRAA